MPIYEYQCDRCGKVVEVFSQIAREALPPAHCTCGASTTFSRRYSAFATVSHSESASESGGCEPGLCGTDACGCMHADE